MIAKFTQIKCEDFNVQTNKMISSFNRVIIIKIEFINVKR